MPKSLNVSNSSFENMRQGNCLYVDKTGYLVKLLNIPGAMYFLSRPRRFGKSLMISTLEAIFKGRRELFQGLAINAMPYDWQTYPVISLAMNGMKDDTVDNLEHGICVMLQLEAEKYHVHLQPSDSVTMLQELIAALLPMGRIVILVDEYDKPLLDNITETCAMDILKLLKAFYSVIKKNAAVIRFAMITGVTQFSHVSLFSDLNNLQDLTMNPEFATMFGYTQQEFEAYFKEWIEMAEATQSLPHQAYMAKIKQWYDGFRFHASAETVYNPVSVASFFLNAYEFKNYWFSTGTPTFLLKLIKDTQFDMEQALAKPVSELVFSSYEINRLEPLALLVQTGYLTISTSTSEFDVVGYTLDFPNREVKYAFEVYFLNYYTGVGKNETAFLTMQLVKSLKAGNTQDFFSLLKSFLADIPYDIQISSEKYYQSIFHALFLAVGTMAQVEVRTNKGRIDAVVSYGDNIFVIEFKIDQPAESALRQIRDRDYGQKYRNKGKAVYLLGISIDTAKREIAECLAERDE